jgi:hypothetical protein
MTFSILTYPSGNSFLSFSKRFCDALDSGYVRIGIDSERNSIVFQKSDEKDELAYELKKYRQSAAGMITDKTAINTLIENGFSGRYWVNYDADKDLYEMGGKIPDE